MYQELFDYCNSLVNSNAIQSYSILELGTPQSTGTVKIYLEQNGATVIQYELFRKVNNEYTRSIINNYQEAQ